MQRECSKEGIFCGFCDKVDHVSAGHTKRDVTRLVFEWLAIELMADAEYDMVKCDCNNIIEVTQYNKV